MGASSQKGDSEHFGRTCDTKGHKRTVAAALSLTFNRGYFSLKTSVVICVNNVFVASQERGKKTTPRFKLMKNRCWRRRGSLPPLNVLCCGRTWLSVPPENHTDHAKNSEIVEVFFWRTVRYYPELILGTFRPGWQQPANQRPGKQ